MAFTGYNQEYLDESKRRAQTDLGRRLIQGRWDLVREHCDGGMLLDYGCASGAFHMAAPPGFVADGWDVNPDSEFNHHLPCPRYDILTLWDVIEHLSSPLWPIQCYNPHHVFITTPNAANADPYHNFGTWKHFKPGEHLHYYTPRTLAMSMAGLGYTAIVLNYTEGALRDPDNPKAIFTACYRKAGAQADRH